MAGKRRAAPPVELRASRVRRALLWQNGLTPDGGVRGDDVLPAVTARSGPAWAHQIVSRLGFVQVDSISAVSRAQHHILFSRNPRFRREDLRRLLEVDRALFENWTHDAAILPADVYPYWRHYLRRAQTFEAHPGYRRYFAPATPELRRMVLRRVRRDGPLRPRDLGTDRLDWNHRYFGAVTLGKITMEYLWRVGELAVTRRDGREKVYDLTSRVIPEDHLRPRVTATRFVDWVCRASLARLVVATPVQIARFFDAIPKEAAATWCARALRRKEVVEVRLRHFDGAASGPLFALAWLVDRLADLPDPARALRLLNPFDPVIHDRQRTKRIFGFDYTIEIWVPAAKRRYGYYVLPILEGDRFIGRIDVKADRAADRLDVLGLWWEEGVKETAERRRELDGELNRLAAFCNVAAVRRPGRRATRART